MKKFYVFFLILILASNISFSKLSSSTSVLGSWSGNLDIADNQGATFSVTVPITLINSYQVSRIRYNISSVADTEVWELYIGGSFVSNLVGGGTDGWNSYNTTYVTFKGDDVVISFYCSNNGGVDNTEHMALTDVEIIGYTDETPDNPSVNSAYKCPSSSATLTCSNPDHNGTVNWYSSSCGGSYVSTGNSLTTSTPGTYYAINVSPLGFQSAGCGSGTIYNYTSPLVDNGSVTNNCSNNADLSGSVTSNGGSVSSWASGFRWGSSPSLSSYTTLNSGSGVGSISGNISGLTAGVTYYYQTFATNCAGTVTGSIQSFVAKQPPAVNNGSATSNCSNNADLSGTVTFNGGSFVSWSSGFRWGTDNLLSSYSTLTSGSGAGAIGGNISGLTGGVTYYYRTFATNECGTVLGTIQSFMAKCKPDVNDGATASSTWCNGNATLTGNVTNTRGTIVSWTSGFRYGADATLTTYTSVPSGSTGAMSQGISGLVGGTTYYYRTYASNECGLTLGNIQSFVAVNTPDMTATSPTFVNSLIAGDYTSTNYSTVMLEGNCTNVRGENLNSRGFYYSINATNSDPDNGEGGVTTITNASGPENSYGAVSFTNNITSLQRGTYYAFKSFGTHTNCVDEGKSSVSNFWTLAEATLSSPSVTDITHNSIDFTLSFNNTGASTIDEYGVVYSRKQVVGSGNYPLIGGTDCIRVKFETVNTNSTSGTKTATVGGDHFTNDGTGDLVTGNPFLYSNTIYYIRPFIINNGGTYYGTVQEVLTEDLPFIDDASISLNNEISGGDWSDINNPNSDPSKNGAPQTTAPDNSLSQYGSASNDTWRSWSFDGSSDYFTIPYNTNSGRLNENSGKTLFIYFRTQGTNINNRQVLLELASSNSGMNVYIYSGKIWAGIWNSTQRRYFSKSITTSTNYLFNIEFNGSKVRTALNGECSSSMLFSGFSANSNLNGIGVSANGTRYMDLTRGTGYYDYYKGKIADILMYNDCSQSLRTSIMNFFDEKYGNTFRNNYTAYFGKAAAEAGWDEYETEVSPFDNNDNTSNNNLEVYKSQKELMINLNLDESENIELAIFDLNGIKVGTISNNELKKGINNFTYSTENLVSGVYIVRAIGLSVNESVKVNLVK